MNMNVCLYVWILYSRTLSLGSRLMVLRGRRTLSTRSDFMVLMSRPVLLLHHKTTRITNAIKNLFHISQTIILLYSSLTKSQEMFLREFLPHHIPARSREPQDDRQRNKRETDEHSEWARKSTHNRERRAFANINMCVIWNVVTLFLTDSINE